jgi:hypothetical protein
MAASNIGMMDGAYFVGRNEILAWINTTLQLGLSKVEEVSGARPWPLFSICAVRVSGGSEASRICGEDALFVRAKLSCWVGFCASCESLKG